MENKLKHLREAMDSTTHKEDHFTEAQKEKIRNAVTYTEHIEATTPKKSVAFAFSIVAVAILALLISTEYFFTPMEIPPINGGASDPAVVDDWEIRHEFEGEDGLLFSVYPDPGLSAERPYGYIFSFTETFDQYEGKEMTIKVVHQETGESFTAFLPTIITEPSSGYDSLERFTIIFELPHAGLWRYEVYFDNELYGDVVLQVGDMMDGIMLPADIPAFVQVSDFDKIDWDRRAVRFGRNMVGNEDKAGVIGADMPSLHPQKWMWHLWGVKDVELTVVAFHRETETVHSILQTGWKTGLSGAVNGADTHTPSTVTIPFPGEWAILLYTDGELFDILVYEINE